MEQMATCATQHMSSVGESAAFLRRMISLERQELLLPQLAVVAACSLVAALGVALVLRPLLR